MIFLLLAEILVGVIFLAVCIDEIIRAIQVLFHQKERFLNGTSILFFLYKTMWGKDSPKYIAKYEMYVQRNMKFYAILALIFIPLTFLFAVYIFLTVLRGGVFR